MSIVLNEYSNGSSSAMIEQHKDSALSGDIAKVQKDICINYLLTMSSGHMASIIQSTKYADIDRAIIQAWQYFNYVCTDEEFINIGTDPKEIESIILKAYKA